MPKKILIVIDMQNDFITGSLGSKAAEGIVPIVAEKIKKQQAEGGEIVFTLDTHDDGYMNTPEGKALPVPHCIKGTLGHQLSTAIGSGQAILIEKPTFGSLKWTGIRDGDELELCGLCTDICLVSNALILKAKFPNSKITVDSVACAGTSKEAHQAALTVMRSCQIEVI
ncbi:MAG: cysteine hydrolase [Clostridia bacterium]|nr:cysteine hydrolase [Clostridia bacterium]